MSLLDSQISWRGTLVHELNHADYIAGNAWTAWLGSPEIYAHIAEIKALQQWLKEGKITASQYRIYVGTAVSDSGSYGEWVQQIVARVAAGMHVAAAFMPEYHAHTSLSDDTYKKNSTAYYQGLWGVEANPDGPAKRTPQ